MQSQLLMSEFDPLYPDAKIKHGVNELEINAFKKSLRHLCNHYFWQQILTAILKNHRLACLCEWDLINCIVTKIDAVFLNPLSTQRINSGLIAAINNTTNLDECLSVINDAVRVLIMHDLLSALHHGMHQCMRPHALKQLIGCFSIETSVILQREYDYYLRTAPSPEATAYLEKHTSLLLILIDLSPTAAMQFARRYIDLNQLSASPFFDSYESFPKAIKQIIQLFFAQFQAELLLNPAVIEQLTEKLQWCIQLYGKEVVTKKLLGLDKSIKDCKTLNEAEKLLSRLIQELLLEKLPDLFVQLIRIDGNILVYYFEGFPEEKSQRFKAAYQLVRDQYTQANLSLAAEDVTDFARITAIYCIELITLFELFDDKAIPLLQFYLNQSTFKLHGFLNAIRALNHEHARLNSAKVKTLFRQLSHAQEDRLLADPEQLIHLLAKVSHFDYAVVNDRFNSNSQSIHANLQRHLREKLLMDVGECKSDNKMVSEHKPSFLVAFFDSLDEAKSEQVWREYWAFVAGYDKANKHAAPEHQEPFQKFIKTHFALFLQMFLLLDLAVFPFLKSYLGASTLKLWRFFDVVSALNREGIALMQACLSKWPSNSAHDNRLVENLCIAGGSLQLLVVAEQQQRLATAMAACQAAPSFVESLGVLTQLAVHLIANKLKIPDFSLKLASLPFEKLGRLVLAAKSMASSQYNAIYLAMLQADFSPFHDFSAFIEGQLADSPLSKKLATHNAAIIAKLEAAGIDTSIAMNYPKSTPFVVNLVAGQVDFINLFQSIWQNIQALEEALNQVSEMDNAVAKMRNESLQAIEKIKGELHLQDHEAPLFQLERIKNQSLQNLIRKLTDKLVTFKLKDVQGLYLTSLPSVYECNERLSQNMTQLIKETACIANVSRVGLFNQKTYHLEVWDKNRMDTLFLGDYVGCCLATSGAEFPAMVQRRMDKAFCFIVVIDEASNEPVALNWLFFGADRNAPQDVYVVANYFEIRAGLGFNTVLRHALLSRLLLYTSAFSETINSKGFLIRPMPYGLMQNDLDFLPSIPMQVTKVGDSFNVRYVPKHFNSYFLKSLEESQFKRCDATLVKAHFNVPTLVAEKGALETNSDAAFKLIM